MQHNTLIKLCLNWIKGIQWSSGHFYCYIQESLKAGTRSARTGGETAPYKIAYDTCIEHLTKKTLLSDIRTKNELTKYLSKKLYQALNSVAFVVSYEKMCITNITDLNENLKIHNHEEADTCIILHTLEFDQKICLLNWWYVALTMMYLSYYCTILMIYAAAPSLALQVVIFKHTHKILNCVRHYLVFTHWQVATKQEGFVNMANHHAGKC